jgi:DNA polymerase-3 subunit epsilon
MIPSDKPIVFFDLEATGVSPADDRIVDIALILSRPDGSEESFCSLVDPGFPIPREASAIHHITDDMVRGRAPFFKSLAPKILDFIGDSDLGGFGIIKFDIPLLQAELRRSGLELHLEGRQILDALTIFHKMEPRNLAAAYRFYCGKILPEAHRAQPDARAALEVFWAQRERYPELPRDLVALSAFCQSRDAKNVDPNGKFIWRNGEASFNFGKYRTLTLREVASREPSYIEWLMRAEKTTPELARICREALEGKFPVKTGD